MPHTWVGPDTRFITCSFGLAPFSGDSTPARSSCARLHNLLINAAKYTPDGGRIEIRTEQREGFVGEAAPASEGLLPGGHRIMVVDDNRDSAESTTSVLRLLGHDAQTAYDCAGALETARHLRPEVVLLDLSMPGTDGYEILRAPEDAQRDFQQE